MSQYDLQEEQNRLYEDIQKARALIQLKGSAGWEIVSDTLNDMRTNAIDALAQILPGDDKSVLAGHAVFYAVSATIDNLRNAVDNAILRGEHEAPERLQELEMITKLQR